MSLFAKVKCFLACIILYYSIYLHNYKCPQFSSEIQQQIEVNPLYDGQVYLCGLIETGLRDVQPITSKVSGVLDSQVYSHPKYAEFNVDQKVVCAKNKYETYVYPFVLQLYKATELIETRTYQEISKIVGK